MLISEAPLEGTSEEMSEADLVEMVAHHRLMYRRSLRTLRDYYTTRGYTTKRAWADHELDALRRVQPFRYVMEAEVPAQDLAPMESIPEANALFERGMELLRRGGYGVPLVNRTHLMVEAAETFRQLIERHPTSDRIDEAAFYLGEIHGHYLSDQERIAVKWYERCFTWNPYTPHPARYRAALLLDHRLYDRARALELYRESLAHETHHFFNARYAARRIDTLATAPASARRSSR